MHFLILPVGKYLAIPGEMAVAFNQYFVSSMAPATVIDPPQLQSWNNSSLSIISIGGKTNARNLASFKPGISQVPVSLPSAAVVTDGCDLFLLSLETSTLSTCCGVFPTNLKHYEMIFRNDEQSLQGLTDHLSGNHTPFKSWAMERW